jgi:hypothetical protein
MNTQDLQYRINDLEDTLNERRAQLDVNISGQDDEIYKLEEILKSLKDASISIIEYGEKFKTA